ncbi:MAG: DUF4398 domain-containing protein [Candidatus Eisenbacteria bacterium]|uniref:DUF4398 domain-containing protein n=1 Tax=Eiseniibacteriota bacterium TaxID=2212470 RepID=A0A956SDR2_UNCEI|nr:DUF4398 domain-containing protein [Candidatus Eisenbacteria bacterium]MCB9463215.1 DUF4398 domain-containing protein [Candidatus Eisenbacteria bacterium]
MLGSLRTGVLVVLSLALVTVGCSKAPDGLAAEARSAVDAARTAGAEEYAPGEFRAATDALSLADIEATAQAKRNAMMRRFQAAATLYQDAIQKAKSAESIATEARVHARDDADALLVAIRQQIAAAHALLESEKGRQALVGPRSGPALEGLQTELTDLEGSLGAIEDAIDNGDFAGALRMGQAARDQAEVVEAEIAEVIDTGRPPRRQK